MTPQDTPNADLTPDVNAALALAANGQRCGTIAIVGRPNVGKSTLLNALVGQKISITSRKAQTTRHRITGIRTLGTTQFVFVDTPGFQTKQIRGRTALNRNLNRTVTAALGDVDVVVFMVEACRFGPDDAKVLALMPTCRWTSTPRWHWRPMANAAAPSPSSAGPTSASRRCSMRWSGKKSASRRARPRPPGTASPASARWARPSLCLSIRRAFRPSRSVAARR